MKTYRIILSVSLIACAIAVSCNKKETDSGNVSTSNPKITILNPEIEADAAGGVYIVNYTLENTVSGGKVSAFCPDEYDWVDIASTDEENRIVLNIGRNEGESSRTAYITVSYSADTVSTSGSVEITQGANIYDVVLDAGEAVCEYYGNMFTGRDGEHSYYFMLSDNGWDTPNAKVYKFDLFAQAPEDIDNPTVIPGTYTLGKRGETKEMTFSPEFSSFGTVNESGTEYIGYAIQDGTLEITQDGSDYNCRATLTDGDGKVHSVIYYGPIKVYNYYEPLPDFYSNLEEDVKINFDGVEIDAFYYGDYYGFGTYNWYLDIKTPLFEGDSFIIELNQSEDNFAGGIAEGVYTVSKNGEASTFLPGYYVNDTQTWSWYNHFELSEDRILIATLSCPIYGGEITVTKNGDGTYTIDFDCTDDNLDNPHRLTGTWTGVIDFTDHTDFQPGPGKAVRPRR